MAGGGSVRIDGGRATNLGVNIMGSGDVDYGGVADTLQANIAGLRRYPRRQGPGRGEPVIAGAGSVDVGP